MPMTLFEASKIDDGNVARSAIIEMFALSSDVLAAMPFSDVSGGSYSYTQEGSLPGVAFRGFNEAYTESIGVVNPQVEVLRIVGGEIDVDKALIKTRGPRHRAVHTQMKVKAMALYLLKKIVKGDSTADVREFDGIQNRLTGSQIVDAGSTNGGDPLSLIKLDELIDAVDGANALIMSKAMRRRLSAAARTQGVSGFMTWDKNEFGRKIAFYNDLPILICDHDDDGARILDFNETGSGGANASATSIYAVNFGESMLTGLQNGIMEVDDLGEIDAKPVYRTRIEWIVGMAALHGRCAARLRGISNAAVVA